MLLSLVFFALSLTVVVWGADWLVTSAARLARRLRISPLMIGLTVIAFGTSSPELVVSAAAAWKGQAGLAVGNVMGSTAANVGLIVGLAALLRPISVERRLLTREAPLIVVILALVPFLSRDGHLGFIDGLFLIGSFLLYLWFLVRKGVRNGGAAQAAALLRNPRTGRLVALEGARLLVGLAALLVGANYLVTTAAALASNLGVTEDVIGATLVAVGTTIPEIASSLAAVRRGLGDIAVGNILGSNVFNLGFVLGTAAVVGPLTLAQGMVLHQVVPALIFSALLIPLAVGKIRRWEGALLLALYAGYLIWIV